VSGVGGYCVENAVFGLIHANCSLLSVSVYGILIAMSSTVVKIDTSQIPRDKLDRPDFLGLRAQIEQVLVIQKWRFAFSIHETGHLIYMSRAGFKDFLYHGPRIEYDAEKDKFIAFPAAVQQQSLGATNTQNLELDQWILGVAKGHAAGGVFARELTAAPDAGDEQDRQNFEVFCDLMLENSPGMSIDRSGLWVLAQEEVKTDLRDPAFRKEVWERAAEVREKLFGCR
jgi:hypothetical protein